MKKQLLVIASSLTLILSGVIIASAKSSSNDGFIDPSITGKEKSIVQNVMAQLDPSDRENVTIIDGDGNIYANKPSLKNQVHKLIKVSGNEYTDDLGEKFTLPTPEPKPQGCPANTDVTSVSNNTLNTDSSDSTMQISPLTASQPSCTDYNNGPYRRVYSYTGYSWMNAYVHLPGGSDIYENNSAHGDTGFVYTGGWGNTNLAVDAGFQHSPTYDNWAPVFTINGGSYGFTPRLAANQDVFVKFYVPADGEVALYVAGNDTNGNKVANTYVRTDATGWTKSGLGNLIKRMTSIGQTQGSESFTDGSYIKNVHWYSSNIGTSSTNYHSWSASDTWGYCSMPSSKISVNYVNAGEETDNIVLNP